MTKQRIHEIMRSVPSEWEGDNILKGAVIISKYTDVVFHAAEHDILYSEDVDKLIEAGITEEDLTELAKLNWMVNWEQECLACFV